jgi:hypothetical protein
MDKLNQISWYQKFRKIHYFSRISTNLYKLYMSTRVEAVKGIGYMGGRDPGGRLVAHNVRNCESADMSGIGPMKLL